MRHVASMMKIEFDTRTCFLVIAAVFFFSILRGIRFPNIWSYCHFLFNYDYGFTKRGLLGGITGLFDSPFLISYEFFFMISLAIFAANVILLNLVIWNFLKSRNPVLAGSSLVFVSSLAVVFLSHSIGYFDHVGLLITLITLTLGGFYRKLIFLLPAMTIALLTHEAILALFFPVIFMSLLFSINAEDRLKKMVALGFSSAMFVALALFISSNSLDPIEAHTMYTELQSEIEHPLQKDAFDVLHRDAVANVRIMQRRWSAYARAVRLMESSLVTIPVCLVFIYLTAGFLRTIKATIGTRLLAVLASVSPLLLHALAWDMHRWNSLAVTTSFLMLYVVHKVRADHQPVAVSRIVYPVFVIMIFLNGISHIDLFDGYYVKQFPFVEHQQYIVHLFSGKEAFPSIPVR